MTDIATDLFLDLPRLRSHLVDWGGPANARTILLLHGLNLTSNVGVWNYVAPKLAKHFRVLALDQRSHGLSGVPTDNDYGFAALCEDIHSILAELEIEHPIVVGHSWGADVALQYANSYANSVAGAVMIDGGFVGLNKIMTWSDAEKLQNPLTVGAPLAEIQDQVKYWLGECYRTDLFDLIMAGFELRADNTIAPRLALDSHLKIAHAQWEQDANVLYGGMKSPALFLLCMQPEPRDAFHEQFLGWKSMKKTQIETLMPHAQIEWLTNCIHDVHLQRPELILDKIRNFADGIAL